MKPPQWNGLKGLLSLLDKLGVNCHFDKLTIAVYVGGYAVTLKGGEDEKNVSDHRKVGIVTKL
jgi:hypothetical protein